jgi:hypothetical protein
MIQKNSLPNAGGTRAVNTPGLTKWKVPLRRNINTIIFVPIGEFSVLSNLYIIAILSQCEFIQAVLH